MGAAAWLDATQDWCAAPNSDTNAGYSEIINRFVYSSGASQHGRIIGACSEAASRLRVHGAVLSAPVLAVVFSLFPHSFQANLSVDRAQPPTSPTGWRVYI
jgi:hypothetical protein